MSSNLFSMPGQEWPSQEIAHLEEILQEYGKYIANIGSHGLASNLLLYYRDELQETLEDLEGKVSLESYWQETVTLDQTLREKSGEFVAEIGWENYSMQREGRTPPKTYWWWWLDQTLPAPSRTQMIQSFLDWWK